MVLPLHTTASYSLPPALNLLTALLRDPPSLPGSPLLLQRRPKHQDQNQVMHIFHIGNHLHKGKKIAVLSPDRGKCSVFYDVSFIDLQIKQHFLKVFVRASEHNVAI